MNLKNQFILQNTIIISLMNKQSIRYNRSELIFIKTKKVIFLNLILIQRKIRKALNFFFKSFVYYRREDMVVLGGF